jgi:hypothetical protein
MKTLLATAAVLVLCAACSEEATQTRNVKAPATADRAASEAVNEVDQAVSPDENFTKEELSNGVRASSVNAPAATFSTAAVKTTAGESLGEVESVDVGSDNTAVAINVEVGGFLGVDERIVKISASKFTYLPDRNLLVAAVDKDAVASLPEQKKKHVE